MWQLEQSSLPAACSGHSAGEGELEEERLWPSHAGGFLLLVLHRGVYGSQLSIITQHGGRSAKVLPHPPHKVHFFLFIYIHSLPSLFPFILIWRIILLDDGQNNAHCWLVHWLSVLYKYATWEQQKDLVGNVRALMYLGQTPKCHNTPKINQLHFNLSSHNYPQSPQRSQEEQRIWTLRYTVFGVKEAA